MTRMSEQVRAARGLPRRAVGFVVKLADGSYLLRPPFAPGFAPEAIASPASARPYCEAGARDLARLLGGSVERLDKRVSAL